MEYKSSVIIATHEAAKGQCLPLVPEQQSGCHNIVECEDPASLLSSPVGTLLFNENRQKNMFVIYSHIWLSVGEHAILCPVLQALQAIPAALPAENFMAAKKGYSFACLTLSDKGAKGLRTDESGPALKAMISANLDIGFCQNFLLPDDAGLLRALLARLALEDRYDLIVTSGGTGLAPRDITPQVTESLLDLRLPGFVQAMMQASLACTQMAPISRAAAGIVGKSLVVNLPGSVRAVRENLAAILPALGHALKKLNGDSADCGG